MNSCDQKELIDLTVGESKSPERPFDAKEYWGHTGILLRAGATYDIQVLDVENWCDATIKSDPEKGQLEEKWMFKLPLVDHLRRYQKAPWYALVGAISKDRKSYFKIGMGTQHIPERDGELLIFANDAPGFYRNNHGTLSLAVTRLA